MTVTASAAKVAERATRPLKRRDAVAVFILLFAVTSRGVLEVAVSKQGAYLVQIIAALAVVIYLRHRSVTLPGSKRSSVYVALFLLVVTGLVSVFVTQGQNAHASSASSVIYLLSFTAIGLLLALSSDAIRASDNLRVVAPSALILVISQVMIATAQQFADYSTFAGSDYGSFGTLARPAGLTGSYLHYPLVLSVLGIILFGAWLRTGRAIYLIGAGTAIYGILASYSRSGMMILAVTVILGVLLGRTLAVRIAAGVAVAYLVAITFLLFGESPVLARALSSVDFDAAGNARRLDQWSAGLARWSESSLFFGNYTGLFSNVGRNFGGDSLGVVESSLLQQMLNLGLIGAVATYWLLFATAASVSRSDTWVRAGLYACIFQTLIYQSIEVLPFVALLSIVPLTFGAMESTVYRPSLMPIGGA